jgi:hypothetical protein
VLGTLVVSVTCKNRQKRKRKTQDKGTKITNEITVKKALQSLDIDNR